MKPSRSRSSSLNSRRSCSGLSSGMMRSAAASNSFGVSTPGVPAVNVSNAANSSRSRACERREWSTPQRVRQTLSLHRSRMSDTCDMFA